MAENTGDRYAVARTVLSRIPHGVAIVGAADGAERSCATGTAMYVSFVPPMIAIAEHPGSRTCKLIQRSGAFSVSFLHASQQDIAERAGKSAEGADKFAALRIRPLVGLACRVMAAAGLFDMHGHISLRDGDVAYINGRRSSRISVTPAQVAVVNIADGAVVSGEPPAETPLHLGCYRARPEIRSVAHFHPLAATAFATVGKPLITAFNAGAPFGKVVPVYDDPDLVRNDSQGSAMAKDLGKHRAVLLRGHGVAVVAEDVPSCVTLSLYLEENAKRLAYAMTIGDPQPYTDDEIKRVSASLWQPFVIEKTWIDAQERARRAGALDDLG